VVSMVLGAVVTAAVVAWLWVRGRRWDAAFVGLSMVGILILDLALEQVIARRPLGDPQGGYSYPSGNAMASLALVMSVALISSPRARRRLLALGLPAVFVYGGALAAQWWHYPSDVLGGWCLALSSVALVWMITGRRHLRGQHDPCA
jgi:membrane-associated phospholipid phosphatase